MLLLSKHINDEKDCKAYLIKSLGTNERISQRITWNTSKDNYITYVIKELDSLGIDSCGKPALYTFLQEISQYVGIGEQEKFNEIILDLQGIRTSPQLIFDLILDIDFDPHVEFVDEIMQLHRIAAFLIHGETDCGQDLLLTQLFRLTSTWRNNTPIKNDVTNNAAYRNIDGLRRQLTRSFLLPPDSQFSEIIEKICDRWQTKDVVLIFNKVDCVPMQVLSQWLQEFWEPLVTVASKNIPQKPTCLLMFLVDNCGNISTSNQIQINQYHQLPPASKFSQDILNNWIRRVRRKQSVEIPSTLNSQVLLERSYNGIPLFVYEEICQNFGHSWEGGLAKWLI